MGTRRPARTAARGTRSTLLVALVILGAALAGALAYRSSAASPSVGAPPAATSPVAAERRPSAPPRSPLDERSPTVADLDPDLLAALRLAAADAAADGVRVSVTSGRRSPEHQERLLREAIARYGSAEEAARWVATPATSAHVSGDAIDVGPPDAAAWLSEHGAAYGLCRVYENEPWHYERRPEAVGQGCPPAYPDPTFDPRMRR